jgi:predicted O-linked N-acetylglucosamine transferase (SPINDLY family)
MKKKSRTQALAPDPFQTALEHHQAGRLPEAEALYRQILQLEPNHADALHFLGVLAYQVGQNAAAVELINQAICVNSPSSAMYCNLGLALQALGKFDNAVENYQKALELQPDYAEAYSNLGITLQTQGKLDAAIDNLQRAIALKPDYVDAYSNLGTVFRMQGKLDEAIQCFRYALSLKPDYSKVYFNLGNVLYLQGKPNLAIENYQKALVFQPDYVDAIDMLFYLQLNCCDWSSYLPSCEKIVSAIESGVQGYNPFIFLAISASVDAQKQCAISFAHKYPASEIPVWTGQRYQHDKIRIAYLSADFHEHATAYLMAGLFESHDKKRFEITAVSFGSRNKGEMRERLLRSFDRFIDAKNMANREVAMLLQELEIDIAIDLKGYTGECRPGILAHRAAPVQVNYLGYPGTMGADYIDYILADDFVIPLEHQAYYTEKVVYLPDTYQANDSKRVIADYTPTRRDVDLPKKGFVFCCFNNNYKITPNTFDIWMRLLAKVDQSVLWLLEDNPVASQNLKKEAVQRGIAAERLIFAPRTKLDKHLARQKLADLFLDTLPYNAHTTTSDALWSGLPVLTCIGSAFPGRVAASLLNAVGLPELITHNLEEYEALAFKLATTPTLLAEIRAKLAKNRITHPLFDTDRFRRHIEAAYTTMWERQQRGELPTGFAVQPIR